MVGVTARVYLRLFTNRSARKIVSLHIKRFLTTNSQNLATQNRVLRGSTVVKYPAEIVFLKIVFARLDTLLVSPLLVTTLDHHLFSYILFYIPNDDVGVLDYTASSRTNAERSKVNASTELLSPYLSVESAKKLRKTLISTVWQSRFQLGIHCIHV